MNPTIVKNDLDRQLAEWSITFYVSNVAVTGTRTALKKDDVYNVFGYSEGYKFSIIVSDIELTNKNIELNQKKGHDIITLSGVEYRLIGVEEFSNDIGTRFDFGDKFGAD